MATRLSACLTPAGGLRRLSTCFCWRRSGCRRSGCASLFRSWGTAMTHTYASRPMPHAGLCCTPKLCAAGLRS
eukprot:5219-Prymnesium_polylepis.1